uniref:Transmembrane protein 79b n=1 Tax=Cynoglossus semilaevis TaxID=244447 RepID=A0A3P8WWX6_CYNSE
TNGINDFPDVSAQTKTATKNGQSGPENSWTESDLMVERARQSWAGLKTHPDEPEENELPEKAAQVFYPAATKQSEGLWEGESEKNPFLDQHGQQYEWMEDTPSTKCNKYVLKVCVSLVTSALFFPFLVWGGFVFLPFDAPVLDDAPLRLVYTLRCSVFAATPILLGWLVLGVIRLRSGSLKPLLDDVKGAELHEVTVHRRFVSDSASLFLIYFLHLVVLSMYLGQEQLKLIPLLTIVFALGRLVYWVAAAFGSSIRGFGFGLSFLPSLAMMVANIYFIFTVEGSIFNQPMMPEKTSTPPQGRQRFWG